MKDALGVMLKSLESYQPHDSVKSVCLAKRLELESALQAIPKKNQSNVDINKNLLKFIDCRIEYVNSISENPDRYDTPTLGKPELSGLLAKWHPFDAVRQKTALDKQVKKLRTQISKATNDQDLKKIARSLKTEHFSERMVLMGLMRHADGINDAREAFGQALDQTLRHQNWAPVSCNILIPTSKPENGPVTTETLTTDLVCQGTMMTDAKKIWILSEESPLKPGNFDDFKNTAGKTTGGVRSRSTDETKNPTIAAHTSCRVDDKKIFGATRTGVNDPYGLNKEKLQTKSSAEVAKLTRDVIGLPVWSPTQVRLGDSQSKLLNDVDQEKTTNALYKQSRNAIVEYLLVTDDGQKILTEADVSLNEESLEIRTYVAANFATRLLNQTDTKSNETLARVAISCKPLQMIMRRQGALNRARVTFLFEIQRDAAFAERIKNGKPITFTSISLLTPDRLRQYGFDKFGIDGMNEQEMLDLHVQSWHDLQTEIDSGGLYVNGQAVKAAILPMNFGVNVISFNKFAAAPVIGELICGFKHANTLTNHDSLNRLLGINKSHPDEKSLFDIFIEEQADLLKLTSSDEEKKAIEQNMGVVVQLGQQITDIFRGDKYKTEGNDPYKIASRIALLSFMIGGGTVFNCKSGKDRTGQLDIEAKFLAFQIKTTGKVPDPEIEKTDLQRAQQAILMLFDQTRTKLQEYSTGVTGSKVDLEQLFLNLLSVDENATDQQIRSELDWIKQELQGAAQHSGSM